MFNRGFPESGAKLHVSTVCFWITVQWRRKVYTTESKYTLIYKIGKSGSLHVHYIVLNVYIRKAC